MRAAFYYACFSAALFASPALPQNEEDPWYTTALPDSATSPLIPFKRGELYGYKNHRGKTVIKPRFIFADFFYPEGSAPVIDKKGSGYIDMKGKLRYRADLFDNGPDPFFEGFARYIEMGKLGFIDRRLKSRIPAQFGDAFPFRNGWTSYCIGCERAMRLEKRLYAKPGQVQKGKWGLMDTTGTRITPPIYGAIQIVSADIAKVCIDKSGQPIDATHQQSISRFGVSISHQPPRLNQVIPDSISPNRVSGNRRSSLIHLPIGPVEQILVRMRIVFQKGPTLRPPGGRRHGGLIQIMEGLGTHAATKGFPH